MKKLISMLAATSLVVTAPLSVAACSKKSSEIGDEKDYTALLNNLMELCQQIFETNMAEDFLKYFLMSFEDFKNNENEFDIESLWAELKANKDDKGNYNVKSDSDAFETLGIFMNQNANLTKLKQNASKDILSNVNFKPLIKDGKNPFINSNVNLTELTLVDKVNDGNDKDRIFSIQYVISTEIEILDTAFQPSIQKVNYKSSITFIEDEDLSEEINTISTQLSQAIVSDKYANNYKFFYNDSNLSRVSQDMAELSNFEEILNNDISQDISGLGSKWSLNTEELKFESSSNRTLLGSGQLSGIRTLWNESRWSTKSKEALIKGGDAIDELAKNNNDFIPTISTGTVIDFLKLYGDSSKYFNTAYLWDKYNNNSNFKSVVEKEGINLDQSVETAESRRLFALIGNTVKNIKIQYQHPVKGPIDFELPSAFIVNREYTTFENTQIWYDNFIKFNLLFNREFLGFNKPRSSVSNEDWGDIFELTKPKSFDQSFVPDEFYDIKEIFSDMFSESLERVKNSEMSEGDQNWHPEYYLSSIGFSYTVKKFKVNAEGYVFLYSASDLIEIQMIQTYFGSPKTNFATDGPHGSIHFYVGEWSHMPVKDFGDGIKTPLKFNLDE